MATILFEYTDTDGDKIRLEHQDDGHLTLSAHTAGEAVYAYIDRDAAERLMAVLSNEFDLTDEGPATPTPRDLVRVGDTVRILAATYADHLVGRTGVVLEIGNLRNYHGIKHSYFVRFLDDRGLTDRVYASAVEVVQVSEPLRDDELTNTDTDEPFVTVRSETAAGTVTITGNDADLFTRVLAAIPR